MVFVSAAFIILNYSSQVWVDLVWDDAYYYLGTARSLVLGYGSSFLPPFTTNGYQPLWLFLLTVFAYCFGVEDIPLALELQCLSFLSILFFGYLARKFYRAFFLGVAVALAHPSTSVFGMETALLPAFSVLFFSSEGPVWRGLWASMMFLARLDALALIIGSAFYSAINGSIHKLKYFVILVPVICCYCIISWSVFGLPVPISGLMKSVGNMPGDNVTIFIQLRNQLKPVAVLFFAVAFVSYHIQGKFRFNLIYFKEIFGSFFALVLTSGYYWLNSGWIMWPWYFWALLILSFYLALEALDILRSQGLKSARMKKTYSIILIISLCYMCWPLSRLLEARFSTLVLPANKGLSFGMRNVELANYFKNQEQVSVPFVAMGDRAGSFGFFIGNQIRFFHTEGLVGSIDYYQAISNDRGFEYIKTLPLDFFVVDRENYIEEGELLGVIEPIQGLSARWGPWLICFPKDAIVFDQSYLNQKRYLLDFKMRIDCPQAMIDRFHELRSHYGAVRKFSLGDG